MNVAPSAVHSPTSARPAARGSASSRRRRSANQARAKVPAATMLAAAIWTLRTEMRQRWTERSRRMIGTAPIHPPPRRAGQAVECGGLQISCQLSAISCQPPPCPEKRGGGAELRADR
jgi:hypothetical protein